MNNLSKKKNNKKDYKIEICIDNSSDEISSDDFDTENNKHILSMNKFNCDFNKIGKDTNSFLFFIKNLNKK